MSDISQNVIHECKYPCPANDLPTFLHATTLGAQDAGWKTYDLENPMAGPLLAHVVEPCVPKPSSINDKPIGKASIPLWQQGVNSAVANVRINGSWTRAHFEVGGQRIMTIDPVIASTFWLTDGGRCFPFLEWHKIVIEVFGDPTSIEYDVVEVKHKPVWTFGIISPIHYGDEILTRGHTRDQIRLYFNHPSDAIYLQASAPLKSVAIQFPFMEKPLPLTYSDGRWSYIFQDLGPAKEVPKELTTTLNFSRCERDYFIIEREEAYKDTAITVKFWASTIQVVRMMNGMAGLAWSK